MGLYLDFAKFSLVLILLSYASWSDWCTREVSDNVWIVFALGGLTLTISEVFLTKDFTLLFLLILSFSVIFLICFSFSYFGLVGEADSKAFICLALTFPWPPKTVKPILGITLPIFPLSFLTNALALSLSVIVFVFIKNILWKFKDGKNLFKGFETEAFYKKVLMVFVGYKIEKKKLRNTIHLSVAEKLVKNKDGKLRRSLELSPYITDLLKKFNLEDLPEEVWVTPRIPMIIFILAGFLVTIFLGDIIFYLIFRAFM